MDGWNEFMNCWFPACRQAGVPVSGTIKMHFTYIIKSEDGKHRYVGHCKNLKSQLNQHNSRNVKATRDNRPWQIIHSEKFKSEKDAIFRERFFRSTEGQKWLLERGY